MNLKDDSPINVLSNLEHKIGLIRKSLKNKPIQKGDEKNHKRK